MFRVSGTVSNTIQEFSFGLLPCLGSNLLKSSQQNNPKSLFFFFQGCAKVRQWFDKGFVGFCLQRSQEVAITSPLSFRV